MEEKRIKCYEYISVGKTTKKNDDDIYIGENFVAVIDGVSNKSTIETNGKKIRIAGIIAEAIKKIDRPDAPVYAKTLTFKEFSTYINMYIKKYCDNYGINLEETPLEATGVIYSKYYNQIWLVGDCIAIYDGKVIENKLKIDKVYTAIRTKIVKELKKVGFSREELFKDDIAKKIIADNTLLEKYFSSSKTREEIEKYIMETMHKTLTKCGFTEDEIQNQGLLSKYKNPKELQKFLKNNPDARKYGYSVFNGISTEFKNCVVRDLPDDVKQIRLSSDGFRVEALNNHRDLGYAYRTNRALADSDPLSIKTNKATGNAVRQNPREEHLSIDDATAVIFLIEKVKERDDER